jgi:hypothetical protein
MKMIKKISRTHVSYAFTFCLALMMILFTGCSKDEGFLPSENDTQQPALKSMSVLPASASYELTGSTHFPAYSVVEKKVISPWDMNMLGCTATLTIDGMDMVLETKEYFGPDLMRMISFTGKVTPGGTVKFVWPETFWQMGEVVPITVMLDQISEHTGCEIYGPNRKVNGVPNLYYYGYFDGKTFYADTEFMGKMVDFGTVPFYSEAVLGELVKGPIQFTFSIELETVE